MSSNQPTYNANKAIMTNQICLKTSSWHWPYAACWKSCRFPLVPTWHLLNTAGSVWAWCHTQMGGLGSWLYLHTGCECAEWRSETTSIREIWDSDNCNARVFVLLHPNHFINWERKVCELHWWLQKHLLQNRKFTAYINILWNHKNADHLLSAMK